MSEEKIVIYGHQASRASRPYWLLREYGKVINEDFLEGDTGGPVTGYNEVRDSEDFLALNPYRLIPVMRSTINHWDRLEPLASRAFRHPRKTLLNNLCHAGFSRIDVQIAMKKCGLKNQQRPHQVTLDEYCCLAQLLKLP